MLRLLAGLTAPEQGELRLSPPTATVGHLPQEPERRPGETVREFLARRTRVCSPADMSLAERLFLSVRTVESHRAHIQQKLGLSTRADLVKYALEHKLLEV